MQSASHSVSMQVKTGTLMEPEVKVGTLCKTRH